MLREMKKEVPSVEEEIPKSTKKNDAQACFSFGLKNFFLESKSSISELGVYSTRLKLVS